MARLNHSDDCECDECYNQWVHLNICEVCDGEFDEHGICEYCAEEEERRNEN